MGSVYCPNCLQISSRLIKEICGHTKCRQCFISEEIGCLECIKISTKSNDENQNCATKSEECVISDGFNERPTDVIHSKLATTDIKGHSGKIAILENILVCSGEGNKSLTGKKRTTKGIPKHIKKIFNDDSIAFKCTICNKIFASRTQQYYHINCNNTSKRYKCELCPQEFSSLYHLKYHTGSHRNEKFECVICKRIFSRNVLLQKHMKKHEKRKSFICEKCGSIFLDKSAYRAHCNKHENINQFKCDKCEKVFFIKSNYIHHKRIHLDKKDFHCEYCGAQFHSSSSHKQHLLRHSNERKFTCNICSKIFIDKRTLLRHQEIHNESLTYKCLLCEVRSKRKDNLIRHVKNMHKEQDIQSVIAKEEENLTKQIESKNEVIEENKRENDFIMSVNEVTKEQEIFPKITRTSSVIRSIGNVNPVIVSKDDDLKKVEINASNTSETRFNINQIEPGEENQVISSKKRKKKYDPCEMYRKILLVSNDDDSVSEQGTQSNSASDIPNRCASPKQMEKISEQNVQLNFAEIHWRKRTSQYFSSTFG